MVFSGAENNPSKKEHRGIIMKNIITEMEKVINILRKFVPIIKFCSMKYYIPNWMTRKRGYKRMTLNMINGNI